MSQLDEARSEIEEKLIKKALEDEEFKQLLLTNPHGAIAEFDVNIPEDMEIKILEETAKTSYLVLPFVADELSDEALDLVAGGGCGCNGFLGQVKNDNQPSSFHEMT
ncbi:NHLP leader peptide family RiPP precursor [Anaerotignum sp.]|uniref:NHLP leader peptide family RiPP precursor n=1 Tax=Anaerotignum sp. TaxID=2039241 RepID=UPI002714B1A4|nr:NHLP leader peptide family RiPP precursor [Anaerotignum sp.]